jgi:PAS domain S-box-containing protein
MDGFEVCQRLKADPLLHSIPVVFLTALRSDRESRVKALEVGAEAFLSKPWDEQELVAQVRAMTKLKSAHQLQRMEKEELAALVTERTRELEQRLTERKQAEEALKNSREDFQGYFEMGSLGMCVTSPEKGWLAVNERLCQMLGYSKAELIGFSWIDLTHPDDLGADLQLFEEVRAGKRERYELDKRFIRKDGSVVYTTLSVSCQRHADGTVNHFLASLLDITKRKQAEEALQSSLREKIALLNEVHHRVKNNLQVITSLLRMEARRCEHPTTKTVLDEMRNRILSMALLHDLLYRSGTFASVDLGSYLKQLTNQSFRAQIVRPGSVRLQLDLTSVQVEMDQALPCGLLVNELISNCLKHGFPCDHNGEVRVELQPMIGGPQLRLRVSDTGVGLPADIEAKLGNSLGLQLVSSLARQIDGRLEVGPGPGAVFEVIFTPKHSEPSRSSPPP